MVTDRNGILHLAARTRRDLYFAWGFASARDRLWQLEYNRRAARGTLWEWFGNRTLRQDGGSQLFELGARGDAIAARDLGDPDVRLAMGRYAEGINAYLTLCRAGARPWPPEFEQLGRHPDDWKPADSYAFILAQALLLDLDLPELEEADSLDAHGAGWLRERHRFEDDWHWLTIPDSAAAREYGSWPRSIAARAEAETALALGLPPDVARRARRTLGPWVEAAGDPEARASNVFAVGPARAAHGKPLLANDPHLPLATPGALHVVHLSCTEDSLEAVGAYAPAIPVLLSGRNRRCAWGLTTLSGDAFDVYADTLTADGRRVRTAAGEAAVREADFAMRFSLGPLRLPPLGQKRRYTPHGPAVVFDRKRRIAYSVRAANDDDATTLRRLLGIERSRSAAEVAERVRSFVQPRFNFVAADVDGAVRYQTVGALPRRGFAPRLGALPGDGRHEWLGRVAPDSMPAWDVPASGFVVNANNLPVGGAYPEPLPRFDWRQDRAHRLAERLAATPHATLDDMMAIQNDVVSIAGRWFVPRLVALADSLRDTLSPRARAALDTLRGWDDVVARDRVAPTLYRAWYGAWIRRAGLEDVPGRGAAALDGRAPESFRDPRSGAPEHPAVSAVAALDTALARLENLLGPDLSTWSWGRAHRARFAHSLAWAAAGLEPPLLPMDGDNHTPSVGRSSLPWDIRVNHGPVWRHVVDLADPKHSWGIVTPGNSGVGPHARDLAPAWADHRYVPLDLDWDEVEALRESEWRLVPAPPR
jgi:penicillin amidase